MPLTGLEHLLVLCDDIEASREFYCDLLGLELGERPPLDFPGYWLYLGGVPCVHLAKREEYAAHAQTLGLAASARAARTGAVDHVAFDATGYEEIRERLERHGVEAVENAIPAAGLRQLFLLDPDGVRIEINVKDG
jgi:catechol 2,3-dioxygenase-like lactoylglutathione lyase family enzyme